ncbi:unnamed protein product [Brassicogethes aeneus]|uniref:Retrotransposon gag domain-containing protein n=1 Tax=Brassicogethes aeneus TaxID=1431903 RepID=A0A9P0F950_BRAAE|nr:unnamed protein product [Brassicogethes aeneus]
MTEPGDIAVPEKTTVQTREESNPQSPIANEDQRENSIYVEEADRLTVISEEITQLKETMKQQAKLLEQLLRKQSKDSDAPKESAEPSHQALATGQSNFFCSTPNKTVGTPISPITMVSEQGTANHTVSFSEAQCQKMMLALSDRTISMPVWHGEKPRFAGHPTSIPTKFLKIFDNYCTANNIENKKLIIFKSCLEGSAVDWATMQGDCKDFGTFKEAFLNYYWSPEKQLVFKKRFLNEKYIGKHLSYSQFFLRKINLLKYLTPPMSEAGILQEVMQLFPINVQSLWGATADRTIAGTLQFIDRMSALDRGPRDFNTHKFDPKTPPPRSGNFNREN